MEKPPRHFAASGVDEAATLHCWEFWNNPFNTSDIMKIVEPGVMGRDILGPADEAAKLLAAATLSNSFLVHETIKRWVTSC